MSSLLCSFLVFCDIPIANSISPPEHHDIMMVTEGMMGTSTLHCAVESNIATAAWSCILAGLESLWNVRELI